MTEQKLSTWVMYTMIFALIVIGGASMVNHVNNQYGVDIDDDWRDTYGALNDSVALAEGALGYTETTTNSSNPISSFINTLSTPFKLVRNTITFFSSLSGNLLSDGVIPLLDDFNINLLAVIQSIIAVLLILLFISMALRWRVA